MKHPPPVSASPLTATIERAWVEEEGQGELIAEQAAARGELIRRGVPTETFHLKRLQQRRVPLDRSCLVVGAIPAVRLALRQLGVEPPAPLDYPTALAPWLRRTISAATVREVARALREGSPAPTFVKPRDEQKLFTGFVVAGRSALPRLEALGLSAPIWRGEVVGWRCERRYFVLDGEPVADRPYAGNERERPDAGVVREALAAWRTAGGMPRACAADFGVLDDGRTALVEVNDAFGLGAYGLDDSTYLDLLVARWSELAATLVAPRP